ncbi:MAG: phosphate acetyltransferase [Clostridiales bacterium]|nr:phosphate acetyltransferase [Clostridiales bacterium]
MKQASQKRKTIVLSETEDIRILEAASKILENDFANLVLVGDIEEMKKVAPEYDLSKATILNPENYDRFDEMVNMFYELRKHKGMTEEKAREVLKDSTYFATMLVKMGIADGLVCGATHSTADTLRPGLQIIKAGEGVTTVSAFSIMEVPNCEFGNNGTFFFADTGLVENPNAEQLAEIAIVTADSYKAIMDDEPIVAMLSYSTYGSAKSELTEKVIEATKIVKERRPDLLVDGELQLDAAIIESVGKSKAPESKVAGRANVLVFPDLNCGNIGYKIVERLAKANAYGPITQGMAKPINDLSRGCKADDIVGAAAITCLQAK